MKNEINPTKSADFTTTLDVPTIEHAWKLPKSSGNRTQYAGKKYVIAFSQCKLSITQTSNVTNHAILFLIMISFLVSSAQKKTTKRFCERIDGIHTSSINEYTTHLGSFSKV